ncbi:MAG: MAPEG family protein [Serpentinimonas sp.]|jgi:uncharacterized MAPEG superfamily protein|nr:MAPEG family protein [Serpentinimonas sp.]
MTIAIACVLIAGLLPLAGTAAAKWGFQRYDNRNPREWLAQQTGLRARGNAAQANGFEAFPFFASGVALALIAGADAAAIDRYAVLFVLARVAYTVAYLMDKATLRSLCWLVGILSVVALHVHALMAA